MVWFVRHVEFSGASASTCARPTRPHHGRINPITSMSHLSLQLRRRLTVQGWAVFDSESDRETKLTLAEFGETAQRARLGHDPDPRTLHVEDESMRLHSAHPRIRWVAWHCVSPEPTGCSILLRSAFEPFKDLPAGTQEALRHTTMGFGQTFDGDPERCPVARDAFGQKDWIFFAPWFWREGADEHLDAFAAKLRAIPVEKVRLQEGQVLLIDNARMLHGFEPSPRSRQSLLIRRWLAAHH